jgi:hypothetical protein
MTYNFIVFLLPKKRLVLSVSSMSYVNWEEKKGYTIVSDEAALFGKEGEAKRER